MQVPTGRASANRRVRSCPPNTLINWIGQKKFGFDDGSRRFGGATRIYFPTLRAFCLVCSRLSRGPIEVSSVQADAGTPIDCGEGSVVGLRFRGHDA